MKQPIFGVLVLALAACGGSGGSGVTFSPSTVNCANPAPETETVQLPSSVKATDAFTETENGKQVGSGTVGSGGFTQQSDGTWKDILQETTTTLQQACATTGGFATGTNTLQFLDSNEKVLATGSFTVTR